MQRISAAMRPVDIAHRARMADLHASVWIVVRAAKAESGHMHACDDLDTICPRPTRRAALKAYAGRWLGDDNMGERVAVRAVPCNLPEWGRFDAAHCYRIL